MPTIAAGTGPMLKASMLILPSLLLAASCVPPVAAVQAPSAVYVAPESEAEIAAYQQAPSSTPVGLPATIDPAAIAPGAAAAPFAPGGQSEHDFSRSLQCLATAIYYEARSESEDGQRAVAQVVLNRVRHPAFPNSVCGVVYQGSQRRTGCQFSFTCDGSMTRGRIEGSAWSRARRLAEEALSGAVFAPVGLATHFHTTAISPWWAPSLKRAITVGSHIFYRWRGEWGQPLAFRQSYAGEAGVAATEAAQSAGFERTNYEGVEAKVLVHRGAAAASGEQGAVSVRVHRSASVENIQLAGAEATAPPIDAPPADDHGVTVHTN